MTWTSRPDNIAACDGPCGPVKNEETLARLLHSGIADPPGRPFRRTELFPDKKRQVSNVCGDADGVSVVRCDELSDDDLRKRAQAVADLKAGGNRVEKGALLAFAQKLRAFRVAGRSNEQMIYVYDDPKIDDALHAVVRGTDKIPRPDQDEIVSAVSDIFARKVPPRTEHSSNRNELTAAVPSSAKQRWS